MGTQKTYAYTIESLMREYAIANIPVCWLVIGDILPIVNEKDLFFLKRYLVNKTDSRDFILMDWNGDEICQCRWEKEI